MSDFHLSDNLDQLLLALYGGPLEEPLWQGFLRRLRDELAADYATLLLRPPSSDDRGVVLNAVVVSPAVYSAYNDTWFALDPFVDLPADTAVTLSEFLPRESLESTDYYRQYMKPLGVFHMLGVDMPLDDGTAVRLRVTRGPEAADFSDSDRQLVEALVAHVRQAVSLQRRIVSMQTERDVYADAFGHLDLGAIILDAGARLLHCNPAARTLLNESTGLVIHEDCLRVGNRQQDRLFRDLLDEVLAAHRRSQPGVVRVFRLAETETGLLIRPLPRAALPDAREAPAVAVFISRGEATPVAPVQVLMQLFDLTAAEAALSLLLVRGLSLDEAAADLGVSRNTVKSHLSAVFAKTGVNRQTQLVQRILKSVAAMGRTQST